MKDGPAKIAGMLKIKIWRTEMSETIKTSKTGGRIRKFVFEFSGLLLLGAIIAVIWANTDYESYHAFVEYEISNDFIIGHLHNDGHGHVTRVLTIHYLVNDLLMALFFAIAGKEVFEAVCLKNGSLRGKKAATPLIATIGGIVGPIAVYLAIARWLGSDTYDAINRGWAIPTATDIAFSYLVGRIVFGAGHPAVRFLLLLAIADDAVGLIILAIFYPSGEMNIEWLLLSGVIAISVYFFFNWLPRHLEKDKNGRPISHWIDEKLSYFPYLIAACISWYAFMKSGIHPALGLLPIVLTMPHADIDFGLFDAREKTQTDLMNRTEHKAKLPVEVILLFFGLCNAGVPLSGDFDDATIAVLLALLVGKPLGIFLMGWFGAKILRFGLPDGMKLSDIFVLGNVAAIGFTVALFVSSVAFTAGAVQSAAKIGALLSIFAALQSILVGKIYKVKKVSATQ